jgi:hypothetical protein
MEPTRFKPIQKSKFTSVKLPAYAPNYLQTPKHKMAGQGNPKRAIYVVIWEKYLGKLIS